MANRLYNAGLRDLFKNGRTIDNATYKALLVRSTSTYSPNKDDDTISGMTGLVEISVASYTRQTIANPTVVEVDASDAVKIDFDDIAFGTLESGQTVLAIIIYRHVTNDTDSVPLAYIDTDSGGLLPRALGGGSFTVQINSSGFLQVTQA